MGLKFFMVVDLYNNHRRRMTMTIKMMMKMIMRMMIRVIKASHTILYNSRILRHGGAPQIFSFLNVLMFYVLKQVNASILKVLTLFKLFLHKLSFSKTRAYGP